MHQNWTMICNVCSPPSVIDDPRRFLISCLGRLCSCLLFGLSNLLVFSHMIKVIPEMRRPH